MQKRVPPSSLSRIVKAISYRWARMSEAKATRISWCSEAGTTPQSLNLVRFGGHGIGKILTVKHSHCIFECSIRLFRVNEKRGKHHERLEHGSDVEDGLVVVAFSENRR